MEHVTKKRRDDKYKASSGPQSVLRVLTVLELLASDSGGISLAELSRTLGYPKSSLFGLMRALVATGYVERSPDSLFQLGNLAIELGRLLVSRDLPDLAQPHLDALVSRTGETALLGQLSSDSRRSVYIAKSESSNPVRYSVPLRERRELYASALGKVLLAHLGEREFRAYLAAEPLRAFTPHTITTPERLAKELAEVRQRGLAHTADERVEGTSAVAAPIFGVGGRLEAAIVLAGPTSRFVKQRDEHGERVKETATALSRLMGFRDEDNNYVPPAKTRNGGLNATQNV